MNDLPTVLLRGKRAKVNPTHRYDPLELCTLAGERLKKMGFSVANVSMRSEAVYYRFPGRAGLLRVSAHRVHMGHGTIGHSNTIAQITFAVGRKAYRRGERHFIRTAGAIDHMIWLAVGQYFEREPKPSRYLGKRGTWEEAKPA